jgi:hypothetical protein
MFHPNRENPLFSFRDFSAAQIRKYPYISFPEKRKALPCLSSQEYMAMNPVVI